MYFSVRVRTCEEGDVFEVFTREGDTCELFNCAVARASVCNIGVSHVCVYAM